MPRELENDDLDKYIDNLSGIEDSDTSNTGVSDDNGAGAVQDQQQQQSGAPANKQPTDEAAQAGGTDPLSGTGGQKKDDKKGQQLQQGQQAPKQEQLRPLGDGTFANAKGDIVDDKGNVLAERGFAARIYNQNRRMKEQLTERTEQLNELSQSVGELRSLATSIQRYGLDNTEVAQAMDIAGRMKRGDHLGVAKEVLAMVVAQGYNVTDLLGKDVGDSIETRAIQRMIDERLAPITRMEQGRQQETEAQRRGKQAYDQFVAGNEYADVHADAIVNLMRRENVNPQTAYNRLFQFAVQNQLDFSQDLGPQIEARMQQQTQQQQQPQAQQQQQQRSNGRPMPNGATSRMTGAVPSMPLANADDDWGSIISEVQRTIGGH